MAKSSRSSSKKINNQRKAATIFGPAETARAERLSAKLLEAAQQPKPESTDINMDAEPADGNANESKSANETSMDVDSKPAKSRGSKRSHISGRISKRKKNKVVFTKFSDRIAAKKKKAAR